jgi:putative heme-binding domain-containing protein
MRKPGLSILGCILFGCVWALPVIASEPWADQRLKNQKGIEFWYDTAKIPEGTRSIGKKAPLTGGMVSVWPDASGNKRHALQKDPKAQPKLKNIPGGTVLRFDGEEDHFRAFAPGRAVSGFTIAIVGIPHSNTGDFRGLIALNSPGGRDYETGLNLDLSPQLSMEFSLLNAEGRGFGGYRNLMKGQFPFGTLHRIVLKGDREAKKVELFVDGALTGTREWNGSPISIEEITLGARYYTNGPGAMEVRGHFAGDLAELIGFDHPLSQKELSELDEYLKNKYQILASGLPQNLGITLKGFPLVTVDPVPPVQVLLPGFTVKQLPLDLPNLNNLKYRHDGKLVALGYGGDVWILEDTDGDGLEDKATPFFINKGNLRSPIGMAWTPKGHPLGHGLVLGSKGKISLLSIPPGKQIAEERVIASGWKELIVNVDALGIAFDPKDNSIYFGLGVWDFSNAFQVDKKGKAGFRLDSERGTIMRLSADLKTREVVCTGIRFPVALDINKEGDLFCTDQEGATWLPNGNPLDELLHIQKDRHYGFPPRHPVHLPNVIDEPSVFDYGPQHQSTCGLWFNRANRGGKPFGPAHWIDDALVCGESRGKLYRTKIVKTPAGYVAANQIIGCLDMLTVDATTSPSGDMVVCVHSGAPDWGTGPTGKGRIYKISYSDQNIPQPVLTWASGPKQVSVAFDKPLSEEMLSNLTKDSNKGVSIVHGAFVRAGDTFESMRPGYEVVRRQMIAPRFPLEVRGVQITPDRRTLVLNTDTHNASDYYALTLQGMGRPALGPIKADPKTTLGQYPQVDLDYTLNGIQAKLFSGANKELWSGWLPHFDPKVSLELTKQSATHEELWRIWAPGTTIKLSTKLWLKDMLRPIVQPGARLDHTFPPETVTLILRSNKPFIASGKPSQNNESRIQIANTTNPIPLQVELSGNEFSITWSTAEDSRERAFPLHRFLLPWAPKPGTELAPTIAEVVKGDWAKGRAIFKSDQAGCAKCHQVAGEGATIGPDLSNLIHRDLDSVTRDITHPSHAIHPDYLSYVVTTKSGRVLTGTIRRVEGKTLVSDNQGVVHKLEDSEIETTVSSAKSIMPEGIPALLGPEKMQDLLAYLLSPPPSMPLDGLKIPYPARTRAEVESVLEGAAPERRGPASLRVLLVAGPKDHGPGEHDYPSWQKQWKRLLSAGPATTVDTAWEWPSQEQFKNTDLVVLFQYGDFNTKRAKDLDAFLEKGGGVVLVHWAVAGRAEAQAFSERIGLSSNIIKYRHGPLDLDFGPGKDHPITRNLEKVHFHDESYWKLTGDANRIRPLATGIEEGATHPLFWVREQGKGRIFVSIPGHYNWTFDDPLFRVILFRGMLWSAKQPVDRYNELVWPGARLRD